MKKAIKCGKLFCSENGKTIENAVVLIENDKVLEVTGANSAIPGDFEIIDLSKYFVMPGMIDAHVHIAQNGEPGFFDVETSSLIGDVAFECLKNAQIHLNAGFTTLRDCGTMGFCDVSTRNAINSGMFVGPRLYVAGQAIGSTGGHADSHYNPYTTSNLHFGLAVDGADEARKAARYNLKHGADFLKFMATGGVLSKGTTVGSQQLTYDEMRAICEIAEMYGVITATHAHGTNGIKAAARAGVTTIEHCMILDDEAISLMLEHGTYLTPTIIAAERIVVNGEKGGMEPWAVAKAKQVLSTHEAGVRKCLKEGVKFTFGTDSGTPYNFCGKQAYEFELMCSFGFSVTQALTAATKTNSEMLRAQSTIGSLEVGKFADIVAFAKSPYDDIKTMTDCRFVMKGGAVIKSV